eukprot:Platyproteum_vivax@DN1567_c0_g1_i1.p1
MFFAKIFLPVGFILYSLAIFSEIQTVLSQDDSLIVCCHCSCCAQGSLCTTSAARWQSFTAYRIPTVGACTETSCASQGFTGCGGYFTIRWRMSETFANDDTCGVSPIRLTIIIVLSVVSGITIIAIIIGLAFCIHNRRVKKASEEAKQQQLQEEAARELKKAAKIAYVDQIKREQAGEHFNPYDLTPEQKRDLEVKKATEYGSPTANTYGSKMHTSGGGPKGPMGPPANWYDSQV